MVIIYSFIVTETRRNTYRKNSIIIFYCPKNQRFLFGRRHRLKTNIEVNFKDKFYERVDWIYDPTYIQWRAFVSIIINPGIPYETPNFLIN